MRIKLNQDVTTSFTNKGKNGYSTAEVQYTNEKGEAKTWKLISFANPAVYETFKTAKAGESYDIVTGKNDKDYTTWVSAVKVSADEVPIVRASAQMGNVGRSTYETPEERAVKQRLIVRQSSLAQAIVFEGARPASLVSDVLSTAERFADWVYEKVDLFDEPNDLTGA